MEQTSAPAPLVVRPDFATMSDKHLAQYLASNASYVSGDDRRETGADKVAAANLVFDRKLEGFAAALEDVEVLNKAAQAASEALQAFPKGPMGLTPDEVKFSPPYQAARDRYERAAKALRDFNSVFTSKFAAELREHRAAVRQAKLLKNS